MAGTWLSEGWTLTVTPADAFAVPTELDARSGGEVFSGYVPGTVAQALEAVGRFDSARPTPLDDVDVWYVRQLDDLGTGDVTLHFDGLATFCDMFLDDELMISSQSMFVRHRVDVTLTGGEQRLWLCFRAMGPRLAPPGGRARWRPQMIVPRTMKNIRSTVLGRMPGWCPEVHAVGPWRPVRVTRPGEITDIDLYATLDADGVGHLDVALTADALVSPVVSSVVSCAGVDAALRADGDRWTAHLDLPDIEPWWPHTHGTPALHDVVLKDGATVINLGHAGFRRIEADLGTDGEDFGLLVNGVPIFCRGAVWTNADIVSLPGDRASYEPWLRLAAEAGMNLLRVGGTMTYESPEFFTLCDELGILVWQDFMFANFDYPATEDAFADLVRAEARDFLASVRGAPSLAVLCGGSEVFQQAAMLGRPASFWSGPIFDDILPAAVTDLRPDCVYVPNSPFGGAMPFTPRTSVTHYYGVGAYLRPVDDARRAEVRFATECLAFSHLPEQSTLDAHLPVPPVHDPRWKERIPRDRGASWDFEDVRDFYLAEVYAQEPIGLRRRDPHRYVELSRVVTGEVCEQTYAEWRRPGSTCHGAIVWTFQDLLPGAGWGVVDSTGEPKPVWYALRRAFRPLQVLLTDEGTNGVDVQLINESAQVVNAEVEVGCLRNGAVTVIDGRQQLKLDPRTAISIACTTVFGSFFDTNQAYSFGSPAHDVVVARLRVDGEVIATAYLFPHGRAAAQHRPRLAVRVVEDRDGWALQLSTDQFAQSVQLTVDGFRPADNYFHLAPGAPYQVRLVPRSDVRSKPAGEVTALGAEAVRFSVEA